jgi:hypothetical protein
VQLERWLGEFDALFLRRNHATRWSLFPGPYGRPCLIGGKISLACCPTRPHDAAETGDRVMRAFSNGVARLVPPH